MAANLPKPSSRISTGLPNRPQAFQREPAGQQALPADFSDYLSHSVENSGAGKIHDHQIDEAAANAIEVDVTTLDDALKDAHPTLIKIDGEGYELPVLQGTMNTLASPALKAIVMELNPAAIATA